LSNTVVEPESSLGLSDGVMWIPSGRGDYAQEYFRDGCYSNICVCGLQSHKFSTTSADTDQVYCKLQRKLLWYNLSTPVSCGKSEVNSKTASCSRQTKRVSTVVTVLTFDILPFESCDGDQSSVCAREFRVRVLKEGPGVLQASVFVTLNGVTHHDTTS
jgi:hypothetical protein